MKFVLKLTMPQVYEVAEMININFIRHDILEFGFKKDITQDTEIQLEVANKTTVGCSEDETTCVVDTEIHIQDKDHKGVLDITTKTRGFFEVTGQDGLLTEDEKENINQAAIAEMQPYWGAFISLIFNAAGLPPFILPKGSIEK